MQTIERNEPTSFGTKLGAVFLIGFAIYGVVYVVHYNSVKAKSAYKFTIGEIVDDCVVNSALGNLFEYKVNGEIYRFCKVDDDLRVMKKGELWLVKFYIDDPSAYDLQMVKVPKGVVAPTDGWSNVPNFH